MEKYGVKETQMLEYYYRNTSEKITFPVGTIYGKEDGPTLVVVGGMHGSEFGGIQAAIEVLNRVNPEELKGKLVVCTIYNMPAFVNHTGFLVPFDGKNPMATFPGRPDGTYGEAMAYHFFQDVVLANNPDFLIELHGGDIPEALTPFISAIETGDEKVDEMIKEMAQVYNIPCVIHAMASKKVRSGMGSLYGKCCLAGIPAMLTESGQQGILNMDEAEVHTIGILNVMKKMGMLEGEIIDTCERIPMEFHGAIRNTEGKGMWYPFVTLGQMVKEGDIVGEIRDYFGNKLRDVKAPISGKITVIRTSPSVDVNVLIEMHEVVGE